MKTRQQEEGQIALEDTVMNTILRSIAYGNDTKGTLELVQAYEILHGVQLAREAWERNTLNNPPPPPEDE